MADKLTGIPTGDKVRDAVIADFDGDLKPDIFMVNGAMRPADAFQADANTLEVLLTVTGDNVKILRFKSEGLVTFDVNWNVGDRWARGGAPQLIDIGADGFSPGLMTFSINNANDRTWGIRSYDAGSDNIMLIGYDPASQEWMVVQPGGGATQQSHFVITNPNGIELVGIDGLELGDGPIMPKLYMNTAAGLR